MNHPALPALLGFVALLLIAIPSWGLLQNLRSRERGLPGEATIIEKEERPFKGIFYAWVDFGGRRSRVPVPKELWKDLVRGDSLDIRYDAERPGELTHGTTNRNVHGWPHANLIWSGVMALGVIIAIIAWRLWFDDYD